MSQISIRLLTKVSSGPLQKSEAGDGAINRFRFSWKGKDKRCKKQE